MSRTARQPSCRWCSAESRQNDPKNAPIVPDAGRADPGGRICGLPAGGRHFLRKNGAGAPAPGRGGRHALHRDRQRPVQRLRRPARLRLCGHRRFQHAARGGGLQDRGGRLRGRGLLLRPGEILVVLAPWAKPGRPAGLDLLQYGLQHVPRHPGWGGRLALQLRLCPDRETEF